MTDLERLVVQSMFGDRELDPIRSRVSFDDVLVAERSYTGVGFIVDFEASDDLRVFREDVSLRWGKVGARLNEGLIDTGYLVYVDDGLITGIEGYTYGGEPWPARIHAIDLYRLK